jgi:hypothetical protein
MAMLTTSVAWISHVIWFTAAIPETQTEPTDDGGPRQPLEEFVDQYHGEAQVENRLPLGPIEGRDNEQVLFSKPPEGQLQTVQGPTKKLRFGK